MRGRGFTRPCMSGVPSSSRKSGALSASTVFQLWRRGAVASSARPSRGNPSRRATDLVRIGLFLSHAERDRAAGRVAWPKLRTVCLGAGSCPARRLTRSAASSSAPRWCRHGLRDFASEGRKTARRPVAPLRRDRQEVVCRARHLHDRFDRARIASAAAARASPKLVTRCDRVHDGQPDCEKESGPHQYLPGCIAARDS